jgi:hypothetical protein
MSLLHIEDTWEKNPENFQQAFAMIDLVIDGWVFYSLSLSIYIYIYELVDMNLTQ